MAKGKLTIHFILSLLILALSFNCKETSISDNTITIESYEVNANDIKQIQYTEYALSDLAAVKTTDWLKFDGLKTHIETLKTNNLSFFRDDKAILKGYLTDLKNEIPSSLNTPSILVRLSVLETTMYQLNETSNLKGDTKSLLLDNIKNVLISYNNLILQINKKVELESQNISKPQ